jgi:DNA ligase (NAD+)
MITLDSLDLQTLAPEKLGELLIEAKKAYYTGGKPIMDDHTYDTLEEILRQKNPYHRLFQKVGTPSFNTGFDKKPHLLPMGSQNKATSYPELVKYFELKKIPPSTDFVAQPKIDGLSLEIIYQNGKLVEAITRGDGETGDVVTQNVVKMQGFVATPTQGVQGESKGFTGSVRCEIVVTYKDFVKLNQLAGEGISYSNPRNAASGITQRLDGQYSELCTLYAVDSQSPDLTYQTENQKITLLKSLGLTTVETHLCHDLTAVDQHFQEFLSQKRQNYPYEIDGLVVKINDLQLQNSLGSLDGRPKGQVAYKFPAQTSHTRILAVEWQVGPLGTITPVARVEPILVSGAVINFASLANFGLIQEKGLNIGDIIEISRRGDVIPHIEKVISKVTPGHLPAPTHCPACHTLLISDHKFLKCPNLISCPAQTLGILRLFCSTLNIKGISDKTIAKLYQADKIHLPGDFYKLTVDDISGLDNLGEKSAKNIIERSRSI